MSKKYFTLEEANLLLPVMKRELEILQAIHQKFEDKYLALQTYKENENDEANIFSMECDLEFLQIEANTHMQNIQLQGVELKSIETGLIDFPSIKNGEEILLCWKLGEPSIQYSHGIHEGFNGRKKL